MTQTEVSQEKIRAYKDTYYRAGSGADALVLKIGQQSSELALLYEQNGCDCALFITAFNPLGEKQDDAANESAHTHLREALRAQAVAVIEGVGSDPAGEWNEKSYLAFGINTDTARELGRRFEQDAVVWTGNDAIPQLLLLR